MKRPRIQTPKRPRMASSATARTSKEAAMHLVRLEFDAARLNMGIAQAENRFMAYREELQRNLEQRNALINLIKH